MKRVFAEHSIVQLSEVRKSEPGFWARFDDMRTTTIKFLKQVILALAHHGNMVINTGKVLPDVAVTWIIQARGAKGEKDRRKVYHRHHRGGHRTDQHRFRCVGLSYHSLEGTLSMKPCFSV